MNTRLRDPITVRSTSSGLSICYYCAFGFFWIISYPFLHYKALLFYLITSPVPTCLVHNCETSRRFAIPICHYPCLKINSLLIPITATFQTMMNDVFRTVIAERIVVVYLDNILIFTKTEEEHE